MQQMGMRFNDVPEVEKVIIQTRTTEITIEKPTVSTMEMQNQRMFQVTGGEVSEKTREVAEKVMEIPEEDVHLVAQQAGVSLERAREALKQTDGNLAQSILLLTSKK